MKYPGWFEPHFVCGDGNCEDACEGSYEKPCENANEDETEEEADVER